ncbi:efflux RND transporter periplasmic adaptor subunit [Paenibacillaceae bacterium WGS1546]|uniref:efflux RND transporter periplasmic adaptor subunit n=1 Tax=Cohnella sp. WGS1546 TaxID=3366810 RepID=UPI00372CEF0C
MKKKIAWTAILAVLIAAGTWAGLRYFKQEDAQLAPSFATATVGKGTIDVKVSGTGSIQPSARKSLKAGAAATVLKVHYAEGDAVKAGDVLATYEEDDVSSQVRSKEIDLKKKNLELADLQTKFKQAPDDETRDSIALSIQKQQLDIEIAQADIEALKESKGIPPLAAPIDGVLAAFDLQTGDSVNPNAELGEIVNYATLQMVVGVDELDIPKVSVDQRAEIRVEALPDRTYEGKVVAIADEGTSSNGVAFFDVTIELAEATGLKVGMSAEASILTASKSDALYVPVEAVQSSQGRYFVMVPGGGGEEAGAADGSGDSDAGQAPAGSDGETGGMPPQRRSGGEGGGMAERIQNMSDEEREALREQFMAGREGAGVGAGPDGESRSAATATRRVEVEVGINNEDFIEILSGLREGDVVVLPTASRSSSAGNAMGGFPGMGGGAFSVSGITGGASFGGGGVRQFGGGAAGGGR